MTVDRRTFLKRGGASASLFLISASGLFAADGSRPDYLLEDGDTITEKKRRIPVTRSADVVVCGGGPSGFGAAVQAARTGAKVVLVEGVQAVWEGPGHRAAWAFCLTTEIKKAF